MRDSTQVNFLVTPASDKEVKLSGEHQMFAWITKDDIDKYELTDATKNVIRKAFEVTAKLAL